MPPPSEWLEIMLGEIERKRTEAVQGLAEEQARERERASTPPSASSPNASEPAPFSARVSRS
jgi:hypothetical protein